MYENVQAWVHYSPLPSSSFPPGEGESVIPSPLMGEGQGEGVLLLFS